jgi:hypothetical protein
MSAASGGRACSRNPLVVVCQGVDGLQGVEDRVLVAGEPGDELLEAHDQVRQLLVAGGDAAHHGVQVVDDLADDGVLVGQGTGQRRDVAQQALHRAALALEDLDDLEGEPVQVGRRQRLQERPEAPESVVRSSAARAWSARAGDPARLQRLARRTPCARQVAT